MADNNQNDGLHHGIDNDAHNDAGKGAALGGVGGAIVGALAGGPVGAVIGAVAGAAVAGVGVAAVDTIDDDNTVTGFSEGEMGDTDTDSTDSPEKEEYNRAVADPIDYDQVTDSPVFNSSGAADHPRITRAEYELLSEENKKRVRSIDEALRVDDGS